MTRFSSRLPGLAALMLSIFGCYSLLMTMTEPDGEFGLLFALPVMLAGLVFGLFQKWQWTGIAAVVLPIILFVFLWLHGPFCHWDG